MPSEGLGGVELLCHGFGVDRLPLAVVLVDRDPGDQGGMSLDRGDCLKIKLKHKLTSYILGWYVTRMWKSYDTKHGFQLFIIRVEFKVK